jgi:hypothetical protein
MATVKFSHLPGIIINCQINEAAELIKLVILNQQQHNTCQLKRTWKQIIVNHRDRVNDGFKLRDMVNSISNDTSIIQSQYNRDSINKALRGLVNDGIIERSGVKHHYKYKWL